MDATKPPRGGGESRIEGVNHLCQFKCLAVPRPHSDGHRYTYMYFFICIIFLFSVNPLQSGIYSCAMPKDLHIVS